MHLNEIEFGKRVSNLREKKGLSQEELAEKLNISIAHIAHIEIGQRTASFALIMNISDFFDVSLDYLIYGKDSDRELERYNSAIHEVIRILSALESGE